MVSLPSLVFVASCQSSSEFGAAHDPADYATCIAAELLRLSDIAANGINLAKNSHAHIQECKAA